VSQNVILALGLHSYDRNRPRKFGAQIMMNLGTRTPQFPYILEQAMMPIGHAVGAAFAYICFLRRGGHGDMSEANSKDNG
jgi:hypothetical protein